ncbi:MAG: MgtC/SapB family protein [Candidatus Orphnella occulta]|nr:MgtC/SapB family protein [Candidatus Orphnella occulta]
MLTEVQMVIRLLYAAVLGGVVGIEREVHEKAAGFRTHILVCIGSCVIMLTSMHIFDIYNGIADVDPGRIAAQVVSGIGFLGAGTIIRSRVSVVGLTTAASLWSIAGVGLAVGSGLFIVSAFATVLILASLLVLSKVHDKVSCKQGK